MKRVSFFCCLILATLLASAGGALRPFSTDAANAAPQEFKLARLFAHVSGRGYRLYKTGSNLPPGLGDGPWKVEGAVCIVAGEAGPGLRPVYQLMKGDEFGVRFDYTPSEGYAKKAGSKVYDANYWTNQGVAFYVAADQLPGTTPLYRLRRDPGIVAVGPNAGKLAPGSDATLLTTDAALREKLLAEGWKNGHAIGYVWTKAPEAGPLPDLSVRQVEADEHAVKAVVFNQGKSNTGGAQVYAHLFLYDAAGKTVFSDGKFVGGMSPGQWRPVAFETGGRSLVGLRYQVKVDFSNLVKEADESNNASATEEFRRRLKINPVPPGHVVPPSIVLTSVQPSPTQGLPKHTTYRLAVTNADSYAAEMFQPTQKLPPGPCGNGPTDARLLARLQVVRDGQALNAGCKPLKSAADLKVLDVNSSVPLFDGDRLRVVLEDRGAGQRYESQPYAVGWFGLDKTLVPLGCKYFLGRAGDFLCTSDGGMAACEGLRQKGRPIRCTRAGKTQD